MNGVALANGGLVALASYDDGAVIHRDLQSGKIIYEFQANERAGRVALSRNGAIGAVCLGKTVRVWSRDNPSKYRVLKGHSGRAGVVQLSSTGSMILTGGDDGTVRLWHFESGKEVTKFDYHGPIAAIQLLEIQNRQIIYAADTTGYFATHALPTEYGEHFSRAPIPELTADIQLRPNQFRIPTSSNPPPSNPPPGSSPKSGPPVLGNGGRATFRRPGYVVIYEVSTPSSQMPPVCACEVRSACPLGSVLRTHLRC